MPTLLDELAALRREVDRLQGELEALRITSEPTTKIMLLREKFGLAATPAKMLIAMAQGGVWPKWRLVNAACDENTDNNTVPVHIVKIRRRITPIQLETIWGEGYIFREPHLSAIRSALAS